jgi:hypothetical protein
VPSAQNSSWLRQLPDTQFRGSLNVRRSMGDVIVFAITLIYNTVVLVYLEGSMPRLFAGGESLRPGASGILHDRILIRDGRGKYHLAFADNPSSTLPPGS